MKCSSAILSAAISLCACAIGAFGAQNSNYDFSALAATGGNIQGVEIAGLGNPVLNDRGEVAFSVEAKAPIGNSVFPAGIFSPDSVLAPNPGSLFPPSPYLINDHGLVTFVSTGKISPTQSFVAGVYESNGSGGFVTIAAPGAVVDGVQLVGGVGANDFSFSDAGLIAFFDSGSLFLSMPQSGVHRAGITGVAGYPVTITGLVTGTHNELLFVASAPSFQGIFSPHRLVLRTGDRIDGTELAGISSAVASKNGRVALIGSYGTNGSAIFTEHKVAAKVGGHVSDRVISSFLGVPGINDRGDVVSEVLLNPGTPGDGAIISGDRIVITVGDQIDTRIINSLGPPAINDFGVIVFKAGFTDGSSGIVLASPR